MQFLIPGNPVSWRAHGGYGRRSYNPRQKQRDLCRWYLRGQMSCLQKICGAVEIQIEYYLPIPKHASRIRRQQMCEGKIFHLKKPDIDNLSKYIIDCLKTIVFDDDSQIVCLQAKKAYARTPCTRIHILQAQSLISEIDQDSAIPGSK